MGSAAREGGGREARKKREDECGAALQMMSQEVKEVKGDLMLCRVQERA